MTALNKKEIELVAEYISGGLDKVSTESLAWFVPTFRGIADLAAAELKRRGVHSR